MSSPELPTNPPAAPPPDRDVRLRSSRYGDLEEHELIQLLDSVYDERAKARFRESVYISMFVWIAVAWFLLYGPRVIFHQVRLVDPAALLRQQHQEEIARLAVPESLRHAPRPAAKPPAVDRKTLEKLRAAEPKTPVAPAPAPQPTPAPPPPPPETAESRIPAPVPPPAPKPQPPRAPQPSAIPDAPAPQTAFNAPSTASDSIRSATKAASRGGFGSLPTGPTRMPRTPGVAAGAKIISDTQGVDFSAYLQRLHDIIQSSWEPLLPQSVLPPISSKGITGIDFKIMPNGELGGISIISPSGERALDRAAWGSITSVGKFPPLPKEFHGPLIELNCGFYVNVEPR